MANKQNKKLDKLLEKLDNLLPETTDNLTPGCYRWQHNALQIGHLRRLENWKPPELNQLWGLDDEIEELRKNTQAFIDGKACNHAVLTGPRGCGKTTIVTGVIGEFIQQGLFCIQLSRIHFAELAQIASILPDGNTPFIIICNELSFTDDTSGLLEAKAALDDLEFSSTKLLVYATSNRRHLVPENIDENLAATHTETGEIHPGETTEEKISLSDRFGLWISVHQPNEEQFCAMVKQQLKHIHKVKATKQQLAKALRWAEERGSMNGRIAKQYVHYLITQNK